MRIFFALTLALAPAAACAQSDEDAAHRTDRARTAELNRSAQLKVDRHNASNRAAIARYRNAETAYQREREAWRRRVAACDAGDDRACDPT
jgi:hypothetical protein